MKTTTKINKPTILKAILYMITISLAYLAGTITPSAHTQSQASVPSRYIQIDYMKVEPGKLQDYLEIEKLWRPVHEELIKVGKKRSWSLYGLPFAAANDEYNFVTLNVFDEFEHMENQYPPEFFSKAHPDKDEAQINELTLQTRTNVRSDVWILVDEVGR